MDKNAKSKNCIMAITAFPVICIIIAAAWLPRIIIIDITSLNSVQIGQSNAYIFALPRHYNYTQPSKTEEMGAIFKRNLFKTLEEG